MMNLQPIQSHKQILFSSVLFLLVLLLGIFTKTSEGGDDFRLIFFSGDDYKHALRIMTEMEVGKCTELDETLRRTELMRVSGGCFLIYEEPGCTGRRVSIRRFEQVMLKEKQIVPMSIKREACARKPNPGDGKAELHLYADPELKQEISAKRSLEMDFCTPLAEWKQPIHGVRAVRGCFIIYEGFDCTGRELMINIFSKEDLGTRGFRPESVRKVKCNYG